VSLLKRKKKIESQHRVSLSLPTNYGSEEEEDGAALHLLLLLLISWPPPSPSIAAFSVSSPLSLLALFWLFSVWVLNRWEIQLLFVFKFSIFVIATLDAVNFNQIGIVKFMTVGCWVLTIVVILL